MVSPLLAWASMARSELSPLSALFMTVSVLGKARHSNASTRGTKRCTAGRCARREALDFRFADGRKLNQATRYISDLLYGLKTVTENLSVGRSPTLVPPVVLQCLLLTGLSSERRGSSPPGSTQAPAGAAATATRPQP